MSKYLELHTLPSTSLLSSCSSFFLPLFRSSLDRYCKQGITILSSRSRYAKTYGLPYCGKQALSDFIPPLVASLLSSCSSSFLPLFRSSLDRHCKLGMAHHITLAPYSILSGNSSKQCLRAKWCLEIDSDREKDIPENSFL